MPMEEVVAVYNRGIDEGCFQVLTTEEEALILKNPHTYCTTQLALNEKSKSTKVRFISNASCHTGREFTNLNEASVRPPNLTNKLTSALLSFIMFHLPYSSDISHAYRTIKVHPDHWPYQLLIGFNFDQEDWWNYPVTIVQKKPSLREHSEPTHPGTGHKKDYRSNYRKFRGERDHHVQKDCGQYGNKLQGSSKDGGGVQ